jgi:hypothetical protein
MLVITPPMTFSAFWLSCEKSAGNTLDAAAGTARERIAMVLVNR